MSPSQEAQVPDVVSVCTLVAHTQGKDCVKKPRPPSVPTHPSLSPSLLLRSQGGPSLSPASVTVKVPPSGKMRCGARLHPAPQQEPLPPGQTRAPQLAVCSPPDPREPTYSRAAGLHHRGQNKAQTDVFSVTQWSSHKLRPPASGTVHLSPPGEQTSHIQTSHGVFSTDETTAAQPGSSVRPAPHCRAGDGSPVLAPCYWVLLQSRGNL